MKDSLLLWVILAGLANFKFSYMLSQDGEDGPFDIFKKLRDYVGTDTWWGKGFHCFSCTSFWGAFFCTILIKPKVTRSRFIIVWGAVATIAYMLKRYFG